VDMQLLFAGKSGTLTADGTTTTFFAPAVTNGPLTIHIALLFSIEAAFHCSLPSFSATGESIGETWKVGCRHGRN
jgi:hypothetical protein